MKSRPGLSFVNPVLPQFTWNHIQATLEPSFFMSPIFVGDRLPGSITYPITSKRLFQTLQLLAGTVHPWTYLLCCPLITILLWLQGLKLHSLSDHISNYGTISFEHPAYDN